VHRPRRAFSGRQDDARMVDWNRKFRSEYDAARAVLALPATFEPDWQALVAQLALLMGQDGFDVAREDALGELRRRVTHGAEATRVDEADGVLGAVAPPAKAEGAPLDADAKRRAACLKLLRHVHLLNRCGNRGVWIVSLPEAFTNWPSHQFAGEAGNAARVRQLLASQQEHFDAEQQGYLGAATLQALAWCQKTAIVLANAQRSALTDRNGVRAEARAVVQRWFVEDGAGEAALDAAVGTLSRGFKDIVATLNRGHFVITDWVPFRAATNGDESAFLRSEAFAFRARGEGLDVVYVESAFFAEIGGNVLRGQANWTRIIVHELSHLVCGTHDVDNGQSRYAWCGIGPHAGYPHGETLRNADNWAFFAADCAGVLAPGQRDTALRVT
jgi:hypothetical protein